MKKSINELPHEWKVVGIYVMVDKDNSCFRRGATFQQIRYNADGRRYIWFGGTTYYLDGGEDDV